MGHYVVPAVYAALLWWFSTGIVMYIVGLSSWTFRWSVSAAAAALIATLCGLAATSGDATVEGAYLAFTYAVLAWGAQEVGFLTGFVTGPRPAPCPPGIVGWRRFSFAVQAILYHELSLAASGIAVIAVTWNAVNQIGTWTFAILWAMRISSKLNLFLGVRILNAELLPPHLAFVGSFFVKRSMNLLFPVSIALGTGVSVLLVLRAVDPGALPYTTIGFTLLAALLVLAVLEHWFMIVPLPIMAIWSWALRSRPASVEIVDGPLTDARRVPRAAGNPRGHRDPHESNDALNHKPVGECARPKPVQAAEVRYP